MAKKSEKKQAMAIESPVTVQPETVSTFNPVQINRNSSVFTDIPGNDYFTIERFCSERLFKLHTEQKQLESIRSQNRLTATMNEDHETAIKINAIFKTGMFSIQKACEMVLSQEVPKPKQIVTKETKLIDDIPIRYNRIYNCLTGTESRKNLTKKEKSAYGKLQAYYQALKNPVPEESLWFGVTGNLEHDKTIAQNAFQKAVQVAQKKIEQGIPGIEVPTNKMNFNWYADTVKKYHDKMPVTK